jgi:hypothetical protein
MRRATGERYEESDREGQGRERRIGRDTVTEGKERDRGECVIILAVLY